MTSTTTVSGLHTQLTQQGFVHIPYPQSKNYKAFLDDVGTIIQTTPIKENQSSSRLLASNSGMDLHTDHYNARYVAWLCNSQSAVGGASVLLDGFSILGNYSEEVRYLLSQVSVQSHKVFYNDKPSIPLLITDEDNNPLSIYYASWLVNPVFDAKISQALKQFSADLAAAKPLEFLLSEGDLLVVDNHRILHGRREFPAGSGRLLTRFWLC